MDIGAGIAAVSNGLVIAKTLKSIEASYDQARLKAEIAEIYEALSEAKLALVEAREAIADRDRDILRFKNTENERSNLIVGDGGYKYRTDENGGPIGFPVCPKCDPLDGRLVQLVQDGTVESAKCPICQTPFRPVTCYVAHGGTLVAERNARRAAASAQQTEMMRQMNSRNRHF